MLPQLNTAVLNELKALCEADPDKLLKPEQVVAAAAVPASNLNQFFTWDDSEAAVKWRLEEARQLIRRVHVEYDESWLKGPVPAFVSLMSDRGREGGGYRQTPQVLSNAQLRGELMATAKKELEAWARRHRMLRGLVVTVLASAGLPLTGVFSESEISLALQEQREAA